MYTRTRTRTRTRTPTSCTRTCTRTRTRTRTRTGNCTRTLPVPVLVPVPVLLPDLYLYLYPVPVPVHNRPILARTRASLRGPAAAARPPWPGPRPWPRRTRPPATLPLRTRRPLPTWQRPISRSIRWGEHPSGEHPLPNLVTCGF